MNRLGSSMSPYLQQHKDNPVDWWEWGADAFAEARRRDVPILLSVGYSARFWCHVSRSIRAAAGTVFGAVSFVDIRPETAHEPLEEPDAMWQDFADDYIGYVLDRILRWGDSSESGRAEVLQFDPWLVKTGRREPFGMNQRPAVHQ